MGDPTHRVHKNAGGRELPSNLFEKGNEVCFVQGFIHNTEDVIQELYGGTLGLRVCSYQDKTFVVRDGWQSLGELLTSFVASELMSIS